MKQNIYYKVVTTNLLSGAHYSCVFNSIRYIENEWVLPKFPQSKLFVFNDLDAAKGFFQIRHYDSSGKAIPAYKIYKCEVKNPTIPHKEYKIPTLSHDVQKYWKGAEDIISMRPIPNHTVLVDAVMLKELVMEI